MLVIIETHPVQYHAPVYRCVAQEFGIPVTAIYGSDFSVAGYKDQEFGSSFAWDTDLMTGYEAVFVARSANGGPKSYEEVAPAGLANALDKIIPAAVLSIGYRHPYDRAGILCALRRRWPILFRSETTDHAVARSRLTGLARDAILRRLYRRCASLLYIGQRSREHYVRLGVPDKKLIFSPYGVDTTAFSLTEEARARMRAETRGTLGIPPERHVILYSGKLSHRKGVDLIVEAARRFPDALRNSTTILFLGDGAERQALESVALREPRIDARFPGFQNQTRLSAFYHAADLLTLPSRHSETWGLVVNEALLHGLPCAVSDQVGCQPDLVEPGVTGEVFASDDVAAFSAALQRCLVYAKSASTRAKCLERVATYSIREAARGIAEAYSRLRENPMPASELRC